MYSELGDYVAEQQMPVVPGHRIDAIFAQQTGPGERHEPAQLVALTLVRAVVYVLRCQLDQQTGALEKSDPDAIGGGQGIFRVDDLVDEDGDDVVGAVLVGHGRAADEPRVLALLEAHREAGDHDQLDDFGFELRCHCRWEVLDESGGDEGCAIGFVRNRCGEEVKF